MSKRITNRHLVKIGNAALAFGVLTSTVAGTLLLVTTPASAAAVPTSSAVTVDWSTDHTDTTDPNYAAFADLKLSVSQTKNLVNQAVTVSWSGAKQTTPGEYAADYMQIMECWGDESTGPTPEQCQWGAPTAAISGLMGNRASSRDLSVGDDPAQDPYLNGATPDPDLLIPAPQENPNLRAYRVPFRSVTGELAKTNIAISKVFSASTTNEVSAARTGNDGSGQVAFEAQTALEAPQLGCGNAVTGTDGKVTPQGCWLVVVPRGELNPDGSVYTSQTAGRLVGSPLTASVWKNRMVVPLGFQSVSQSCPIGNAEQRIVGSEMIAEAITSWQPALCQSGSTYGYSLLGDGEARRQIVSTLGGASRLAIVADPLDADTADGATIAYAPVAESAVVIAFNIDYKLFSNATNAEQNGLQVEDLTLNARLVAKLLTQSYRLDVPGRGAKDTVINSNPLSILNDPEFLSLNPQFKGFTTDSDPAGLMVALGSTDANALVWSWLRSDPLARAFLAGEPDDNGMSINPNYLALGLATDSSTDSFPKADLTVTGTDSDQPGYSTLDMRPYMNDMHEGAYRTLKADPNVKTSWDPFGTPPSYKSTGAQIPGTRFVLSVTDAASAARYGLTVAKLVNGAGQAVAPTAATIGKGVANMVDSGTGGVLVNDTDARAAGAYPLPLLSYAAVNVCESTTGELQDYAALIDYAVGAGQVSGDARGSLPRGYVPLGATLVAQAKSAASALTDTAAVSAKCDVPVTPPATTVTTAPAPVVTSSTPAPTPTPTPTPTATRTPKPQATTTPPAVVPAPVPSVTTPPVDEPVVEDPEVPADPQSTTDQPLSAGRAGLAGALALGFPSMIAGPLLARRGRKLARLSELDD